MPIEILMPALSPTMTDGNIVKWNKKEGETVSAGEVIAEIETDKATMEVEAVDEGTIGKIVFPEGSKQVRVNQVIALLLEDGEDSSVVDNYEISNDDEPQQEESAGDASAAPVSAPSNNTPAASNNNNAGGGFTAPPAFAPSPAAAAAPAAGAHPSYNGDRVHCSPLAKKKAEQLGVDISRVRGTGPKGRVVVADVEDAARFGSGGNVVSRNAVEYRQEENSTMRKVIATRLLQSKQHVPHFYLSTDCKLDALLDVRKAINEEAHTGEDGKPAYKLSVNDLIVKAVALGLKKVPEANCTWTDENIIYYNNIDVSVAVALEGGLITPIVRNADQKSPVALSTELKDLINRARKNQLSPEEFQGGGFSISNLGMYGIKQFNAIINPPQSCILAVGAGEQRAVIENGAVSAATVMTVTLSCDHRTVDGAVGAEFLAAFKNAVERPVSMLL